MRKNRSERKGVSPTEEKPPRKTGMTDQPEGSKKHRGSKVDKETEPSVPDQKILPQNILLFGDPIEGDKIIYISQPVYRTIHRFTKDKTTNESGGILLGDVIEDFGKTHILIKGFVEAKYSEGTPTTLKFTHKTWDHIHKTIAARFHDMKILGWIHTHPDFGIFLSEYDKFIQENFFNAENQVAYVIDPIQHDEGFYFWRDGKLESARGFYVFDKTGKTIMVDPEENEKPKTVPQKQTNTTNLLLIILLLILVIGLLIMNLSLRQRVIQVEQQQYGLMNSANCSLDKVMTDMTGLSDQLWDLNEYVRPGAVPPPPHKTEVSGSQASDDPNQPPASEGASQPAANESSNQTPTSETINEAPAAVATDLIPIPLSMMGTQGGVVAPQTSSEITTVTSLGR